MKNTQTRIEKLLTEMGLVWKNNKPIEHFYNKNQKFGIDMSDWENVVFTTRSLLVCNPLRVENIQKFLAYFDEKKAISVPEANLYLMVEFMNGKMELKQTMRSNLEYDSEIMKDLELYKKSLEKFEKEYKSCYLESHALEKFTNDFLTAVHRQGIEEKIEEMNKN